MIFTFYSFKGGVGRSMALASVAYLLAERGLRVLVIDFDLEAPGLERYFFDESEARRVRQDPGLIDLLLDYRRALTNEDDFRKAEFRDWQRYVQSAAPSVAGGGRVDLITAGRREPPARFSDYALSVRTFDWQDFFHNWNGERFFDWLRSEVTDVTGGRGYDVVLVDSRTGITEMGGVCAYQLADAVVMLCAANDQNIEGTLRVARDFRSDATLALRRGRELEILVIPARLEENNPRRAEFLHRFEATFPRADFLPPQLFDKQLDYAALALPYDPEFAIIERLVGESASTPSGQAAMQNFRRLADALVLMASRPGRLKDLQGATATGVATLADPTRTSAGFDFFLDDSAILDTAQREQLRQELAKQGLRAGGGVEGLLPGTSWADAFDAQIAASDGLVVVLVGMALSASSRRLLEDAQRRGLRVLPLILLPTREDPVDAQTLAFSSSLRSEGFTELTTAQCLLTAAEPRAWAERISRAWRSHLVKESAAPVLEGSADATAQPYPGARPFSASEEPFFFFGREDEVRHWARRVVSAPVTLLTGAAGVGKTSFLQAGLLAALRVSDDVNPLLYAGEDAVLDARRIRVQL